MTSEAADTTTIQEALDMYVRSLKSGSRSKGKSSSAKPIDHKALYEFVKYFPPTACLQKLTPSDIGQYAEKVNGTGTTPGATAQLQAVKDFLAYAKKNEGLTEENLARYVRIRKARSRAGATVVSTESQTIELTSEGHAQLVSQRERLVQESESLVEEIRRARADGDVTENSPLDAAREEQGRVEARIQEITSTLDKSVIIVEGQTRDRKVVKIGARVEVKDLNSSRDPKIYTLVNRTEANPLDYRISDDSPMGKALLGKRVGQKLQVDTPRGKQSYEVVSIA
ncbi:MAG: transcription elongation factor GreA [Chloroflexi bacterium]|nr:transcription elongation factor GreA [Chloroflexota bacterium]